MEIIIKQPQEGEKELLVLRCHKLSPELLKLHSMPMAVQTIIRAFPPSHGAVLLRQTIMAIPMQTTFEGVPASYLEEFKEVTGVVLRSGGNEISPVISIIVLLGSGLMFYSLSILNMRKMSNF